MQRNLQKKVKSKSLVFGKIFTKKIVEQRLVLRTNKELTKSEKKINQ